METSPSTVNLPHFPLEIWEHIFGYLTIRELKNALLVCHDWKATIVGAAPLVNRFRLTMIHETTLDDHHPGFRHLLARTLHLSRTRIVAVDSWWPALGANLTDFALSEGHVAVPMLLAMLRQTPNLKRLALDNVLYTEMPDEVDAAAGVDFELKKLEHLSLFETFRPRIVDILRPACCRALKSFAFSCPAKGTQFERSVIDLLVGVQRTLVALHIVHMTEAMLDAILAMDQLKLRSVKLFDNTMTPEMVVQICRKQLSLRHLDIGLTPVSNAMMTEIGQLLPNLRSLNTNFSDTEEPQFLATMPNLEQLHVQQHDSHYHLMSPFRGHRFDKLKSLHLEMLALESEDVWQFLNESPNIQSLTIVGCAFKDWSKFLNAVRESPSLERLTISRTEVVNWTTPAERIFNNRTKYLELWELKVPKVQLIALLRSFPQLEELRLCRMPAVDDALACQVSLRFPRLKNLLIFECSNKNTNSLRNAANRNRNLRIQELKLEPLTHLIKHFKAQKRALTGRSWWCDYIMCRLHKLTMVMVMAVVIYKLGIKYT